MVTRPRINEAWLFFCRVMMTVYLVKRTRPYCVIQMLSSPSYKK